MTVRPIKTEADYDEMLGRIDILMDARPGSPDADELEVLVTLVQAYEEKHHPVPPPDPVEAIRFQMEALGLGPDDLAPYIGSPDRVADVLDRKRALTLPMIRRLHRGLRIPLEALVLQDSRHSPSR